VNNKVEVIHAGSAGPDCRNVRAVGRQGHNARRLMDSSSGPTCVKIPAAVSSTGDGQGAGRIGAGLVVGALGLTIGSGRELLRDANFAAAPGTLTAIIGPSGAGKSRSVVGVRPAECCQASVSQWCVSAAEQPRPAKKEW
jgi:hypothetical protein